MRRGIAIVAVALLVIALIGGCSSTNNRRHGRASALATPSTPSTPSTLSIPTALSGPSQHSLPAGSPSTTSRVPPSPSHSPSPSRDLPRGGRAIIGHYRVVAYYGAAGAPALGVLGAGSPEHEARAVLARARGFAPYGLPVQPAMELLATVAQGAPGADGAYSKAVPQSTIRRYLAVVHRYRMLLILDLQPGRSTFFAQAKALRSVLLDPSVSLALDPEWKVRAPQRPGDGLIGSSTSGDIDRTARYVAGLVRTYRLPDKLLVVHEFTRSMLPDRSRIVDVPGVEVTFHADGFGRPTLKTNVFRGLAFPPRPFGVGFKLFLRQDSRLMSPAEVMRLSPRPDVITYQ